MPRRLQLQVLSLLAAACMAGVACGAEPVDASASTSLAATSDAPSPIPVDGRYLLLDSRGKMWCNEAFPGPSQLVPFGYLSCPAVCPTTLATMASALSVLGGRADRVQLVFISVDPERDTGEALDKYTGYFDRRIVGLTGSPPLLRAAAAHFDVRFERFNVPDGGPLDYAVDHTAGTFLLDPGGAYLAHFPLTGTATQLAARIGAFIEEDERRR